MVSKTCVIIGAGPAGLAAAYKAQQLGWQVVCLEKNDFPGGKGGTLDREGCRVDFGPHAYHPLSNEVTDFLLAHSHGELVDVPVVQRLYITDTPLHYPLNIREVFSKFNFGLKYRIARDLLTVRFKNLIETLPRATFKQWGIANYGQTLYDLCFGWYSERVWGISADALSVEFAKRKLPNISVGRLLLGALLKLKPRRLNDKSYLDLHRYMYHRRGIGTVYRNIAQGLKERGANFIYNARIESFVLDDARCVRAIKLAGPQAQHIACDYVISTAPCDELAGWMPTLPLLKTHQPAIRFKQGIIINVLLNRPSMSDAHWIYLVNRRFKFNRLSEPKNFSAGLVPQGKTLVMLEIICSADDPRWDWGPSRWRPEALNDLSFFGVKDTEIEKIFLTKMEKAFPFYLAGYERSKSAYLQILSQVSNFITTGRYGLYVDINMHDAMVLGFEAVGFLSKGEPASFYQQHEQICLKHRDH